MPIQMQSRAKAIWTVSAVFLNRSLDVADRFGAFVRLLFSFLIHRMSSRFSFTVLSRSHCSIRMFWRESTDVVDEGFDLSQTRATFGG